MAKAPLTERCANIAAAGPVAPAKGTTKLASPKAFQPNFDEPWSLDLKPDQVRRKLQNLVDNGDYKVGQLAATLTVSDSSFRTFMRAGSANKGSCSDTYFRGCKFFQDRRAAGLPDPKAKSASAGTKRKSSDKADDSSSSKKSKTSTKDANSADELASIHLDGEESDKVPVYDTCDELRKKINAHLRRPEVSQAGFLRDLSAQYSDPAKKCSAQALATFRRRNGADSGRGSAIMYPAYVFFEKLRQKQGKKKSAHREQMEEIWASQGGFLCITRSVKDDGILARKGEYFYVNKFGELIFS